MTLSKEIIEEARFALHGRILRCPFGDNPEYCPLHEIRKLPMTKRVAWLEAKSDHEVIELYKLHDTCMACRLENYNEEE